MASFADAEPPLLNDHQRNGDHSESASDMSESSKDTSVSPKAEEPEATTLFQVFQRDLLLHLWSSPLVDSASETLPPKLQDWYKELLTDGTSAHPHQPASAHPRHASRRQRNDEEGARGLQPMGDFRAEGMRPRRHQTFEDGRIHGRTERRQQQQQQQQSHPSQQPSLPPPLRSDQGSWRPTRMPSTPSSTNNSHSSLQQQHQQSEELPAWMDDSASTDTPSWFSAPAKGPSDQRASNGGLPGGHIDSIQAFKAQMRAEEQRQLRKDNDLPSEPSTPVEASHPAPAADAKRDSAILSSSRPSPAPPSADSRATPSALDALFSNVQPPAEVKAAATAAAASSGAPRSSRFAKMFKGEPHNEAKSIDKSTSELSEASNPRQAGGRPQDADVVAGFMSSLLDKGSSGNGNQEGGGGQTGPAPAPAPQPVLGQASLRGVPGASQPPPAAQDGDMLRVMQMLQSSASLSPSPVNGVLSASPAPAAPQQQRGTNAHDATIHHKPQSRRDFARPQPSPVHAVSPASSQQQQRSRAQTPQTMDAFQALFGGGSAGPPPASPYDEKLAAPHSVAGMLNMGGPSPGTRATNAPRFAAQSPSSMPPSSSSASSSHRSEPPRMVQSSPVESLHMSPGYAIPRTQPFPPHAMNQQPLPRQAPPPQQQQHPSLYELQAMGIMPGQHGGLPGASSFPVSRPPPPPMSHMYGSPPPPPPHMMSPQQQQQQQHQLRPQQGYFPSQSPQQQLGSGGGGGIPGRPGLSPDLMALFASAGGGPIPQYR